MNRYWEVESGGSLTSSRASWKERSLSYSESDMLEVEGELLPRMKPPSGTLM